MKNKNNSPNCLKPVRQRQRKTSSDARLSAFSKFTEEFLTKERDFVNYYFINTNQFQDLLEFLKRFEEGLNGK